LFQNGTFSQESIVINGINQELQDKVKYLEDEVCRYSNAIEEEYVLKTDYEEVEEELAGKEVLAKAYKEHKIEIMKLKKQMTDDELEWRDYRNRVKEEYGDEAEALEPQYYRMCGWCNEQQLSINEHIFIYEKEGVEEMTLCHDCGEPNPYHKSPYSQLKKEGYTCDEDEDDE